MVVDRSAGIVEGRFRAGVEQEHPAALQRLRLGVLVQDLAVDGRDDGERQVPARGPGHPVDGRGDLGPRSRRGGPSAGP